MCGECLEQSSNLLIVRASRIRTKFQTLKSPLPLVWARACFDWRQGEQFTRERVAKGSGRRPPEFNSGVRAAQSKYRNLGRAFGSARHSGCAAWRLARKANWRPSANYSLDLRSLRVCGSLRSLQVWRESC